MSTRDDSIRDSFLTEHETTPPDSSAREWRRTQKSGISYNTEDGKQTAHPSRMVDKFERAGGRSDAYDDRLPVL
ncbi:hypothetical protein PM025_18205, partial [Halorubrum ezzemoulense]|uniref:hypothetical protein n=1 Tax=Halorubrum ezzemoulense TaxID=337243 RepID=UPI00232CAB53